GGIWAEVLLETSTDINTNYTDSSNGDVGWDGVLGSEETQEQSNSTKIKEKWQWVEAKSKQDSEYRVVVIG
ncbi:hypothetical protein, partial [Vibrio anguillarum]